MLGRFRDHLIEAQLLKDEKFTRLGFLVFGIVILLLIADIIYLNSIIISTHAPVSTPSIPSAKYLIETPTPVLPTVEEINISVTPLPTAKVELQILPTSAQNTKVLEYFISLGAGSSQAGDWEDIRGTEVSVDFSKYPGIKEVHFEASVAIPTANQWVSVRLFNKTDKHPVWQSEVTTNPNTYAYLTSPPIIYDLGEKVYQVQMKTQLQSLANLQQSRIHITLQ
ncbi:hypothetical protein A3D77_06170 [Candidatus Gottesmanbacteria bacterium RIFCSPHIGHO2_02_FULL_39_11]|uniref:Uncharacterized protein n=1 Tax=Candidatus Gottesmanbacteria bacterium RIFCSPHIGHO2_02_FULL_39_11 TaxID=1798382 RepID=A0A1F5ZVS3_9BACT|nr:MAG: hypothetical protein A3D77_06170 [Candidatus Gottesmanbacteria bacterium RIFCSPHIGHO2_02_FULL_39_11]